VRWHAQSPGVWLAAAARIVRADNRILVDDFRDCIAALNRQAVEFVLVGGYAVGHYGRIRATGDIDFLYRTSPTNVARLCAALHEFGAPAALIDPDFLSLTSSVTQLGVSPFRIDLLGSITGRTFEEVWRGAERVSLDGVALRVIALPDLLLNKRATGRAKDRADVKALSKLLGRASPRQ
jgi:predicted nucleotidyltransferase